MHLYLRLHRKDLFSLLLVHDPGLTKSVSSNDCSTQLDCLFLCLFLKSMNLSRNLVDTLLNLMVCCSSIHLLSSAMLRFS